MFIELHILQNFAPSNLNRDDTNQPKDTEFGGWRRARISSQALKRAMRHEAAFTATIQIPIAKRTRLIVAELCDRLISAGKAESDAERMATDFAKAYSSKKGKMDKDDPRRTNVLLFMSDEEFDLVAQSLLAKWEELLNAPEPKKASRKKKEEGEESEEETVKVSPALKEIVDELVKRTKGRTSAPDPTRRAEPPRARPLPDSRRREARRALLRGGPRDVGARWR